MGLGEATSNAKIIEVGRRRAGAHHRTEAGRAAREEVDRGRSRCARGSRSRPASRCGAIGCTSSSIACDHRAAARPRLPRRVAARVRRPRQLHARAASDQLLFPEIDYMKVDKARGMNVSVVTSAGPTGSAQAASADRHAVQRLRNRDKHGHHCEDRKRTRRPRSSRFGCGTAATCAAGPRAYMRKFALCRLCFRKLALQGDVAGVTKSSW